MSGKQTLKQRKALRSAAAKKGWETRQAAQRKAGDEAHAFIVSMLKGEAPPEHGHREMSTHDLGCWYCRFATDGVLVPYVTPWWPLAHQPRPSLWQRVKGWFA